MADRRGSSIAAEVDAAIERVVDHFESNDLALRLDVLRALSAQAQLAFETTRVKERLGQHPVSMDLIAGVTSRSAVFKALAERLTVERSSCDYDARRNAVMATSVRWTLPSSKTSKKSKKRKTAAMTQHGALITSYRYERTRQLKEEGAGDETLLQFTVVVAFGDDDAKPRELLHFKMACEHVYPKSYYEEMQQLPSDDEEEDKSEKQEKSKKEEKDEEQEGGEDDDDDEAFGEELRSFRFDNEVLADVGAWMGAGEEELDPVVVVGFFMALPVHEDEWLIDERVCEILFQGGLGGDSSDEEGGEKEEDGAVSDPVENEEDED